MKPQPLRALTLSPPWGTGIALGLKRLETRAWTPKSLRLGDLLLIHQSKAWDEVDEVHLRLAFGGETGRNPWPTIAEGLARHGIHSPSSLPLGVLVCLCRYHGADSAASVVANADRYGLTPEEQAWGDYRPSRWAWKLELLHTFEEPIPASGKQSVWDLKPETEFEVREALKGSRIILPPAAKTVVERQAPPQRSLF